MSGNRFVLLYDADCGLCTAMRNWVHRLDLRGNVRSIPLASRDADPFVGDLDPEWRFHSMYVVDPSGRRASAGLAALRMFAALPGLSGAARFLESTGVGITAAEGLYLLLVRVRAGLSRDA